MIKNILKNKKGDEMLAEQVIFWILNAFFLLALLLFIFRVSTGSASLEEAYAKKIALIIDSMKQGTEITIDLSELYEKAASNEYDGELIVPNFLDNRIMIKVKEGAGYSFRYFTSLEQQNFILNKNTKKLIIKI